MLRQAAFTSFRCPVVQCRSRKKDMPLMECLDSYVTANAIPNKRSACYRCTQGNRARSVFACS